VVTGSVLGRAHELYQVAEAISAKTGKPFGFQVDHVYAQGRASDSHGCFLAGLERS